MRTTPRVIEGGFVLSAGNNAFEPLDILVEGGKIVALERRAAAGPAPFESVAGPRLSAHGRLVVAGFTNGHTHSHSSLLGGIARERTLEESLMNGSWMASQRSAELTRLSTILGATELLASGCTGVFDLVSHSPAIDREAFLATADAYREVGIRATMAPMVADRPLTEAIPALAGCAEAQSPVTSDPGTAVSTIQTCRELIEEWPFDRDMIAPAVAPTIPTHCSDELLRGLDELAREMNVRLHMHLAESKPQAHAGLLRYGRSITAELDARGMLRDGVTAAHAIWIDGADAQRLSAGGVDVVTVPTSNLRLGSGVQDSRALLDAGVRLSVGTDGANSSDALDMVSAMQLAGLLSRAFDRPQSEWLSVPELFFAATQAGSYACGRGSFTGVLQPGAAADLSLWDLSSPAFTPRFDLANQVITAGRAADVRTVLVAGRIVYDEGIFPGLDVHAMRERANELAQDFFDRTRSARTRALSEAKASTETLAAERARSWSPSRLLAHEPDGRTSPSETR
ncbi:amidohydrolase family protein [Microbacterium sp. NPDC076911]|uniref:amidohydrolase family protein n=1 Tax=Microbacterium sp. NPDC076911 TaxID=3154958 RepID=UPI0034238696